MSMLKKPRRNIRRRDTDNDENDDDTEVTQIVTKKTVSKILESKNKKEKKKPSVLSFEEEWNEGEKWCFLNMFKIILVKVG